MAVVTSDFLAGLFTSFNVIYESAFFAAQNQIAFERFCMVVHSDTDTESYNWLGTVPQMQQWIDERQIQNFNSFNYPLQNLKYEVTIEVNRQTLEDDKYATIRPRIAQLGQEAARFPAKQAALTMANGNAKTGYDGANFFSTTHNEGVTGNQSNLVTGSGTTLANVRADFVTARTAMRRYKDDQGRPMNLKPDLIYAPPDLEDVFNQLINSELIASPTTAAPTNVLKGAADVWVDSNLSDVNDWYLLDTQEVVKPLIYQIRTAPEFTALDAPDSQNAFFRDRYFYGVRARFAFGYGLWPTAVRVTN